MNFFKISSIQKLFLVTAILVFIGQDVSAQVPTSFSYQAVARSDEGAPIANKEVIVEITVLKGDRCDEPGFSCLPIVWQEIHSPTTNEYGLFNIEIGNGQSTFAGTASAFDAIDWSTDVANEYYIKVRVDFGDAQYLNGLVDMGISKLQAVPYSFVSSMADDLSANNTVNLSDLSDVDVTSLAEGEALIWNATLSKWQPGSTGTGGDFISTDGTTDLTGDWTIYDNNITISSGTLSTMLGAINTQYLSSDHATISDLTTYGLKIGATPTITKISTDGTLSTSTDSYIPTEKAVKTYVDANLSAGLWAQDGIKIYPKDVNNRVGIGTAFPNATFHAAISTNEFLVTSDYSGGTVQSFGAGTRMVFHGNKAAFRVGKVDGNHWNNDSIGIYSFAGGLNSVALGDYSFSYGQSNRSAGQFSFSAGFSNLASNSRSFAFGSGNKSTGTNSVAFGFENQAQGANSLTIGYRNLTEADYSIALGKENSVSTFGESAFVTGNLSQADAPYSLVMGDHSRSYATALAAFVGGGYASASGRYSMSFGYYTEAMSYAEVVIGRFNDSSGGNASTWDATTPVFTIGNGADDTNRSNAFVVYKNGNATLAGTLTQSSDKRLKKNIYTLETSLANVMKLRGVSYYWDETNPIVQHSDKNKQIGFIAQELEEVYPELVQTGSNGYKSVNYIGMIPVLLEAIKAQQKEIDALKSENSKLKSGSSEEIARLSAQNVELNNRLEKIEELLKIGIVGEK